MSAQPSPGSSGKFLTKLTVMATLGGLLFGYDTGVISGALLYMKDDLALSAFGEATVVSALLFPGAAFGALFGGRVADRIGRKNALLVCAGLFLVGALGCALAPNVQIMVAARIILGLGVGAAAVTCPLYLAEMAPAERRDPSGPASAPTDAPAGPARTAAPVSPRHAVSAELEETSP